MREACADCVRKHFGAGVSAVNEVVQGYDDFGLYVSGELNNAEMECLKLDYSLANDIREFRIITLRILDKFIAGHGTAEETINELPEHADIRERIKLHILAAAQENEAPGESQV